MTKTRTWIYWLLIIALLATGAVTYFNSYAGKRLIASAPGLFIDVAKAPFRVALPHPTGPYLIGTTELHLVDTNRADPWVEGRDRELMISIYYPARDVTGLPLAPYMKPGAADYFKKDGVGTLGLDPAALDVHGIRTHAWLDAPYNASTTNVPTPSNPDSNQSSSDANAENVSAETLLPDTTRRPVLIYSPGGNAPRTHGTIYVEELASQGYIVVTIDHTYDSMIVEFPDGRLAPMSVPSGGDSLQRMLQSRVEDARFVLDQLEAINRGNIPASVQPLPGTATPAIPVNLTGAMNLDDIGMIGHSAGGFAAMQALLVDDRVDAAINMDGSMGFRMSEGIYGEVTNTGVDKPFMLMGGGFSGAGSPPHTHEYAPDWKTFWDHSTGWKLTVYIPEAEHMSFSDYQPILAQIDERIGIPAWLRDGMIGNIDAERAVTAIRAYTVAFFDEHLRGIEQPLLRGNSPRHPDVDLVF